MSSTEIREVKRGVWSPKLLVVLSLFFSIFPSMILFALNYGRYGFPRKRNLWLLITVILLVVLLTTGFVEPDWAWHRAFLFWMGMTWVISLMQLRLFREWIASGRPKASVLSGVLACLLCIGALFAALVVAGTVEVLLFPEEDYIAYELIENGQYEEAEQVLMAARLDFPDDLDVRYNLAIVYYSTERPELARQELMTILEDHPDHEYARTLLQQVDDPGVY
ncbi:MAG: tetratricopeptide repeat protein [Pontiellaceae bacterium]|nr:tetratricopeptide repeat protein [Pontiellaceae bacterium]MBN2786430.1 tetratricopeptide repeat protein [Pontiellaceae bacterium]